MDQGIRKKIFGYAQAAWPKPEYSGEKQLDEIRAICAELNEGVFSLSALPDALAPLLLSRVKEAVAARRKLLRNEWQQILNSMHGVSDQFRRLVEIAIDANWSPNRVLALICKQRGGTATSWDFPPDSDEMRTILPILESYRRKQITWRYNSSSGQGQGPDRSRRRRARR